MHAFCISGGTGAQRRNNITQQCISLNITQFDTVTLEPADDKEHIGIDDTRAFTRNLMLAPDTSPYRAGIILASDTLTIEAQNALLKILEEPPSRAMLFLETASADQLLPTIISRCQRIHIAASDIEGDNPVTQDQIQTLISADTSGILTAISLIAPDRQAAKLWTQQAIIAARDLLLSIVAQPQPHITSKRLIQCIRNLEVAKKELESNSNPKLVLDSVFLNLSRF